MKNTNKKHKLKTTRKNNTLKNTTHINNKIINILEVVKLWYSSIHDKIHVNAYERAIHTIKKWPFPITSGAELANAPGIGKGMIQKIDTILATGTLPIINEKGLTIPNTIPYTLLHHKSKTTSDLELNRLDNVLGFGVKVANKWALRGITTIKQLREYIVLHPTEINLTRIQQLGLKYHEDLTTMVPRHEIKEICDAIRLAVGDDDIMVFLAGSYPSGLKKESKDIDILLVSRDKRSSSMESIVSKINDKIQIEIMAIGKNKFLGVVKKDNHKNTKWRHLDMRLVKMTSFPFAWSYFSSGKIFNKYIRQRIKKKGYLLNEYGIFKDGQRFNLAGEKTDIELEKEIKTENDLMQYAEGIEKEIFKLAGIPYQTIKERY